MTKKHRNHFQNRQSIACFFYSIEQEYYQFIKLIANISGVL